jgi:glutamate synthase (NADPH/NADH) small chain
MRYPEGVLEADESLCVGCRICERTCAYAAISIEGPLDSKPANVLPARTPSPIEGDLGEVQAGYASLDEARSAAERCLECPDPSCVWGCPAHNDIPGFIAEVKAGDLAAARRALARTSCMPGVCARVCDAGAQCEGACALALAGGAPVSIKLLERFAADSAPVDSGSGIKIGDRPLPPLPSAVSVAVVGGGPAGMAAAVWLLAGGARVELFEMGPELGGVLCWGIPRYALGREVWSPLVKVLEASPGLCLHTSTQVGQDVDLRELARQHDAVLLAHGASVAPELATPGAEAGGVMDARRFLEGAGDLWDPHGEICGAELAGKYVLVVGGGDTAMAVSRTARRLGARVVSIRRRVRSKAQVRSDELAQALSEGVEVRFGLALERIDASGEVVAARLRSAVPRWRAPVLRSRAERGPRRQLLAVDMVVAATGFKVDRSIGSGRRGANTAAVTGSQLGDPSQGSHGPQGLRDLLAASGLGVAGSSDAGGHLALAVLERQAALDASKRQCADRLWIAGDALRGPSSVVEAMAQGREAALEVLRLAAAQDPRDQEIPELGSASCRDQVPEV